MNHNYIRPGGVAADLPDGWEDDVEVIFDTSTPAPRRVRRAAHRPADLPRAHGGRRRRSRAEEALALRRTGPILRSTGVRVGPAPRRCRTWPTTRSTSTSSSAPTATTSTATPSASTRSASRSASCARSLDKMPRGRLPGPGQEGHAAAAGAHRRVDGGADPPLQALHRGLPGARGRGLHRRRVAARRARAATSCPTASAKPFRMHIRGPSFVNLQSLPRLMRGGLDGRRGHHHLLGRPGHGRGGPVSHAVGTCRRSSRAPRSSSRSTRTRARRCIPLCHLAQEQDGCAHATRRWTRSPSWSASTPAEVLRHGVLLRHVPHRAGRHATSSRVHQHRLPARAAPTSCSSTPRRRLGVAVGRHDGRRRCSRSRRPSASPTATAAPCVQVNHRFVGARRRREPSTRSSTTCAPAAVDDDDPAARHAGRGCAARAGSRVDDAERPAPSERGRARPQADGGGA